MKRIVRYIVYHTTETGADYAVYTRARTYLEACEFEFAHRDEYPRPMIIRKETFKI